MRFMMMITLFMATTAFCIWAIIQHANKLQQVDNDTPPPSRAAAEEQVQPSPAIPSILKMELTGLSIESRNRNTNTTRCKLNVRVHYQDIFDKNTVWAPQAVRKVKFQTFDPVIIPAPSPVRWQTLPLNQANISITMNISTNDTLSPPYPFYGEIPFAEVLATESAIWNNLDESIGIEQKIGKMRLKMNSRGTLPGSRSFVVFGFEFMPDHDEDFIPLDLFTAWCKTDDLDQKLFLRANTIIFGREPNAPFRGEYHVQFADDGAKITEVGVVGPTKLNVIWKEIKGQEIRLGTRTDDIESQIRPF